MKARFSFPYLYYKMDDLFLEIFYENGRVAEWQKCPNYFCTIGVVNAE